MTELLMLPLLSLVRCAECGKTFEPNKYCRKKARFCSIRCKKRSYVRFHMNNYRDVPLTDEILARLEEIALKQQDSSNLVILKDACEVCGSKQRLLFHEVRYSPTEGLTLCYSCHSILHHKFLRNRKVRPS